MYIGDEPILKKFMTMIKKRLLFLSGISLLASTQAVSGFELAGDGKNATIVLAEKPHESSRLAAQELTDYVSKITGEKLPVAVGETDAKKRVVIGTLDTLKDIPEVAVKKLNSSKMREAYYICARGNTMYIIGKDEVAELYGTYQFMEDKLGIRWLKAANDFDSGEHVPKSSKIVFDDYEKFREPAFEIRRLDQCACYGTVPIHGQTWAYRNGYQAPAAWGANVPYDEPQSLRYKFYAPRMPSYSPNLGGGHMTFVNPQPAETAYEKHPEYFALVNGKRVKGQQYCLSNKDVQENTAKYIISKLDQYKGKGVYLFGMEDTSTGWCECEGCRAMDGADSTDSWGYQVVSTRFHKVVKIIAEKVFAKYPNADLRVRAYHTHRELPRNVEYDKRLKLQFCTHERCYGHALDDAQCSRNVKIYNLLKEWLKIYPEVYTYDYLIPTSPYYTCNEKVQAHDLKLFKKLGMIGWKDEAYFEDAKPYPPRKHETRTDVFPSNWQWLYVTGKILWDPSLDEDKILDEAESLYYGKTYPVMKQYHALRRKLWADSTVCMGYPHDDPRRPLLLDAPGAKEKLLGYLEQAEKLAGNDKTLRYRVGLDRRFLNDYWIVPNQEKDNIEKTVALPVTADRWSKNFANHPDTGKSEFIQATENEKSAVQVITTKKITFFYTKDTYKVKPWATVKITASVKGKGITGVGVYVYGIDNGKGAWVSEDHIAYKKATNEFKDVQGEYVVKDKYTRTVNGKKNELAPDHVRIVFLAEKDSDVIFNGVKVDIHTAKEITDKVFKRVNAEGGNAK